jgi:hypothetical protein
MTTVLVAGVPVRRSLRSSSDQFRGNVSGVALLSDWSLDLTFVPHWTLAIRPQ